MAAGHYDFGNAQFSTSAAARSAVAYANPLTPGGMNPRNVNIPTLGWVVVLLAVAFLVYHTTIKR